MEARQHLAAMIPCITTDHGSECGIAFAWRLHDDGIANRPIPPDCPESDGKVERSHRVAEEQLYR